MGNGILNLALGCEKADEVSEETTLSMLSFTGLGITGILGNRNVETINDSHFPVCKTCL